MAYGEFYVERQGWARWPRVLIMCRKRGDGIERRRYVPERTCEVESTLHFDSYHECDFYVHELSCGHTVRSDFKEPPKFCEECGARVLEVDE